MIDQRSASRHKENEKRMASISKETAPSNFTVDAVGHGTVQRAGFPNTYGPNSVMHTLKQNRLVADPENKTVETKMELLDGLSVLRRKNTRNSTNQLTRRQNLINNQKLVLLHNSAQDNQRNVALNDYQAYLQTH